MLPLPHPPSTPQPPHTSSSVSHSPSTHSSTTHSPPTHAGFRWSDLSGPSPPSEDDISIEALAQRVQEHMTVNCNPAARRHKFWETHTVGQCHAATNTLLPDDPIEPPTPLPKVRRPLPTSGSPATSMSMRSSHTSTRCLPTTTLGMMRTCFASSTPRHSSAWSSSHRPFLGLAHRCLPGFQETRHN